MILGRRLDIYDIKPWWGGVAYYEMSTPTAVVYPLGLHLLVRWAMRLWEWVVWSRPSRREKDMTAAYHDGFRAGYAAGKRDANETGPTING